MEGPLEQYRALDLTDEKGFLCGRILADLGVDVIKVEPPGGAPSRIVGPFYKNTIHPEKSLYWFAYNANKRGITLNLDSNEGKSIFRKLVERVDFVIESFSPGYMDKMGLGYPKLSEINPRIILTSITPFGQSGPYKDYKAPDIVGMAASGLMYLCGEPELPPVRISSPQAYLHAGGEAAVGSLIAHYHRETTGVGQWVDVAMQQAVCIATFNAPAFWEVSKVILKRTGQWRTGLSTGAVQRQIWLCKDGFVNFAVYGGVLGAHTNREVLEWMDSEGLADDFLKAIDWDTLDMGLVDQELWDQIEHRIARFFKAHTKAELFAEALQRNTMIFPVNTVKDISESEHLKARNFWVELRHPELNDTILYPRYPVIASLTPPQLKRRAPTIGEHNREVYCNELGLSSKELRELKKKGVI